jgi:hypothetical protein
VVFPPGKLPINKKEGPQKEALFRISAFEFRISNFEFRICIFAFPNLRLGRRLHLRQSLLELSRDMRNDAKLALDQHQLRTMMHLVLFDAK